MKWFINSLFYFAPWFIPVNEHLYYFRLGEESRMLARLQFGLYRDELRTLKRRERRAPCFIGNPCASVSIPPSLASARQAVVNFFCEAFLHRPGREHGDAYRHARETRHHCHAGIRGPQRAR